MISTYLTKIIILLALITFAPMIVIGSSDPQNSPTGVSILSTGITKIPIYERPSVMATDRLARFSMYTTSTQIAGSTYTGIFEGCCFLPLTELDTCQGAPSCSAAYIMKTVSSYIKNGGPEAPSKTDPPSIVGNPTKKPAPSSSAGNGMVPANSVLMVLFSVVGVLNGMGLLFCG